MQVGVLYLVWLRQVSGNHGSLWAWVNCESRRVCESNGDVESVIRQVGQGLG